MVRQQVEFQVVGAQDQFPVGNVSPKHDSKPGDELGKRKWLD
jgi:hypothetical protein